MKKTQFYIVKAKCGHVGRNSYIPVDFPVIAASAKSAAAKVRYFRRVKHYHKDAILNVRNVSIEEFSIAVESNKYDPYLSCGSKHEQKQIPNLNERLEKDSHSVPVAYRKTHRERKERLGKIYDILDKEALNELKIDYSSYENYVLYDEA